MSLRGPCGAKLHAEGRKRGLPPGALRGTATAKGPTRGLPPGALRGTTVARSPPPTVCYIVCSSIFVIVCCSVSGSRSEDRSLSDAPLARAQSARGAADVSGTMRRASGALTVCCTACTAAWRPKTGAGGGTEAFPARLRRAHSLRAGPRTSPERCAAPPARSQRVAQRVRPRAIRNAIHGHSSQELKGSVLSPSGQSPIYLSDQYLTSNIASKLNCF